MQGTSALFNTQISASEISIEFAGEGATGLQSSIEGGSSIPKTGEWLFRILPHPTSPSTDGALAPMKAPCCNRFADLVSADAPGRRADVGLGFETERPDLG